MLKSWIALAAAGGLLSGCASAAPPGNAALGGAAGAVKGCAAPGDCERTDPGKRQYYDEHAHRYYYYDGAAGRYFWEDGAPRD